VVVVGPLLGLVVACGPADTGSVVDAPGEATEDSPEETTARGLSVAQMMSLTGLKAWEYEVPEDGGWWAKLTLVLEQPDGSAVELLTTTANGLKSGDRLLIGALEKSDGLYRFTILDRGTTLVKSIKLPLGTSSSWPGSLDGVMKIGSDGVLLRTRDGVVRSDEPEMDTVLRLRFVPGDDAS